MGKILQIITEHSGGTCYQTERFTLDHFIPPEYQDRNNVFRNNRVFENNNKKGKNIRIDISGSVSSLFKYFLDGARRTYKIVDFGSTDGKFLPIVAGQIGAAVCVRQNRKVKKYRMKRENVIAVPDRMGGEFDKIVEEIPRIRIPIGQKNTLSIDDVLKYKVKSKPEQPFENLAIAKIQTEMMKMEIYLIREMVSSNNLNTNKMLIIDGSLQFSGVKDGESIFQNVIGVSKSFNPNLQGILKSKNKQIGSYLTNLEFGERTAVYVYHIKGYHRNNTSIGAWYLRIRPQEKLKNPLDGVIKIEKIATTRAQKENGEESKNRSYVGRHWNRKYLRAIQCVLNATKGIVSVNPPFFDRAFGKDLDEFFTILMMPEPYIIYRNHFEENGKTEQWLFQLKNLSLSQLKEVEPIIHSNNFSNFNNSSSKAVVEFIEHYKHKYNP